MSERARRGLRWKSLSGVFAPEIKTPRSERDGPCPRSRNCQLSNPSIVDLSNFRVDSSAEIYVGS
ncbi:hypothetical protein WN51_04842 [Melipona quadrifasciata]|uniref:Uncharacterized protein n=1 Tax=Melipona quadrifasciata TaxID=166423 RepID=A0A0N0U3Y1_9HYME|nr:hypothetical protein WN51_04842 [Melipona quadrifasciata]